MQDVQLKDAMEVIANAVGAGYPPALSRCRPLVSLQPGSLLGSSGLIPRTDVRLACLQSPPMKIINSIMVVIGWIVVICAVLAALGLGTVHLHFGPFDFRLPTHVR